MKAALVVGQPISGIVVARAPFGVWLDIGVPFPALLLVPDMPGSQATANHFCGLSEEGGRGSRTYHPSR